jgi:hypothetical protein
MAALFLEYDTDAFAGGLRPDISRVEAVAAARRRAMTPYSSYCEWPATQWMRPDRLARRVKIFEHRQRLKRNNATGQFVLRSINLLFGQYDPIFKRTF